MRAPRSHRSRQEGIAIITAMLVVTIATVLAVELAWETNLDLQRTESLMTWEEAHQFGYGAEAFAAKLLEEKFDNQTGATATYSRKDDTQFCGQFSFNIDVAEGQQGALAGGVCDLQGRFNVNNLLLDGKRDELAVKQFKRLIAAVSALDEEVDIDPDTADTIVESAVDWLDYDGSSAYNGAEDDAYTGLQPPYRTANFWFTSVSELRAVRGVTPEIYAALAPYLAALPVTLGQRTLVNVNTASVPVLMSLGDEIDAANAETWVSDSMEKPFEDKTPFAGYVDQAMQQYLGFSSSYFELRGMVTIGTTRLGMYSLLEVAGQDVVPRLRQFDVVEVTPQAGDAKTIEGDKVVEADE